MNVSESIRENAKMSALTVLEHGSVWPASKSFSDEHVVLTQAPRETAESLLRRIYDRMRVVERAGGTIDTAILSCNDELEGSVLENRLSLAKALLARARRAPEGRLVVVGHPASSVRGRTALYALAESLVESLPGSTASVSIAFGDVTPIDGEPIHRARKSCAPRATRAREPRLAPVVRV